MGYSLPQLLGGFVSEELPEWFKHVVDRGTQQLQTELDEDDTESETVHQPPVASTQQQRKNNFLSLLLSFLNPL